MTNDVWTMSYEEMAKQPTIAHLTRPEGYNGDRVEIELKLVDQYIIEFHQKGYHVCPAVRMAADAAEVNWLVDNHPLFKNYKRITHATSRDCD